MRRDDTTRPAPIPARRWTVPGRARRALITATLPLAAVALAGAPPASAAGIDPLPAVAQALSGVSRYQVTVTFTTTGRGRRPTGPPRTGNRTRRGAGLGLGFGSQTRTIVAVRKGIVFEDYIVIEGRNASGQATTTDLIVYGTKTCTRASGARSYTCQTAQSSFAFNLDPTGEFAAGAGSTTFVRAASKTIGGQTCDGYAYQNTAQATTTKGVVYIARKTHLPCEQDATVTRRFASGGTSTTFTQKTATVWSRFNDPKLTVPSVPA